MKIRIEDDFDLQKIAESGQCFRWNPNDKGGYSIVAGGRALNISNSGTEGEFEADCSEKDYDEYWKHYFDLETDYKGLREKVSKEEDSFLYVAAEYGKGIRILNQDPWETLISFIISQRKSIPAIKSSIERLSALAGSRIDGTDKYAFPTVDQLSKVSVQELNDCGMGYRTEYLYQTAQNAAAGALRLEEFNKLDDQQLLEALMELKGVGIKVASCTLLFGFHRLNAFPIDVWIDRVLKNEYNGHFPFEKYDPYNGVMQQYLFFYYRNMEKNSKKVGK
ncbi:MAG: DNA-3-methyladenine glycosylase 2 family protein [Butyrivibrio sp.]|nr:DNA-3-methyladenine glycosylase 2 family protein [Butyrivibrio sp.]